MPLRKIVNGAEVEMTPKEEAAFVQSRSRTLTQEKRAARDAIGGRRALAEMAGFVYQGIKYGSTASDAAKFALMANRARAAKAAGEAFGYRVVALDDSETNLNADEMVAFEKALGDHYQACSANARALRQAVNAALDAEAVRAIDINAGWPS